MPLEKQIWLADVKEDFYPDSSFLNEATDMSGNVNNDVINLAEAGVDPIVLINNTTYPVNATVPSETPLSLQINTYDTESTIVRNAEVVELAYDKRKLYTSKHQKALRNKFGNHAIHAYAPATGATGTNKILLDAAGTGSIIDLLIDAEKHYNEVDASEEDRVIALCPKDQAAMAKESKTLYREIMAKPGTVAYGFKIYRYSKTPYYNKTNSAKLAFGAATDANSVQASVFFLGSEVMKATGTFDFFDRLKDPDIKGDKFNYQMRALALSIRNKYMGAIVRA